MSTELENGDVGDPSADQDNVISSSSENGPQKEEQQPQEAVDDSEATATVPDTTSPPEAPLPAAAPPVRHDWYQTQADVYVNVMIKRLKREDVSVEFGERCLEVCIRCEGTDHTLRFRLAHSIVPQKSSFKVMNTKVS